MTRRKFLGSAVVAGTIVAIHGIDRSLVKIGEQFMHPFTPESEIRLVQVNVVDEHGYIFRERQMDTFLRAKDTLYLTYTMLFDNFREKD